MKTDLFSNSDVTYFNEMNFDLNEWEKQITVEAVKDTLKEANTFFLTEINNRFLREKGPEGKWWPLSPITVKYKKGSRSILKHTGKLSKSIRSTIYADELVITANTIYAKILQFGAEYDTTPKQSLWMWHNLFNKKGHPFRSRRIKIPARPFMGFTKQDENVVRRILIKNIHKSERLGKYPL